MSTATQYNGYVIKSAPYQADAGGFTMNGYVLDREGRDVSMTKFFNLSGKIYSTENDADVALVTSAKEYIDKNL